MPNFNYVAVDKLGKQKKGSVEAVDEEKASARIKSEGLIILELEPENIWNKELKLRVGRTVKPRDLSVFCRQFVSMITAGVTIIDALGMLSEQSENKELGNVLKHVQTDIEKGETLSSAMEKHKKIFPDIFVSMVEAGEASGSLENAFSRMALQFEKSAKLRGLVRKAAIYPMVVASVAVVVIIVMLTIVIPNYMDMFDQLGTELPALTQAVVHMSNFLLRFWYLILLAIAVIVLGIRAYSKTNSGQIFFGKIGYKVPLFGRLTVKSASSQFARTLSTLLYAGIPMLDALDIVGNTMNNQLFRNAVKKAKEDVSKGIPLSEPLERSGLFPPMVYHMTKIGEETGDIEAMLERLADYYDEEVEITTQSVMAALEPIIIIVLAVIVGVLIGAVMAPMLKMYQSLDQL